MVKIYNIYGYGSGNQPLNKGVQMGASTDRDYAKNIVEALAAYHKNQWFGFSEVLPDGQSFSDPIRFTIETSK